MSTHDHRGKIDKIRWGICRKKITFFRLIFRLDFLKVNQIVIKISLYVFSEICGFLSRAKTYVTDIKGFQFVSDKPINLHIFSYKNGFDFIV